MFIIVKFNIVAALYFLKFYYQVELEISKNTIAS